jgi:peptidoglycan-associated lipoprotein
MRHFAPLALLLLLGCPKPPPYPECRDDGDCKDHAQVCIGGTCKECRDDAQCAQKPGTVCKDNACEPKPQCTTNADCPQGQKCAQDKCVPECSQQTEAQDCGEGKICRDGRCAEETCAADADCRPGRACVSGKCVGGEKSGVKPAACDLKTVYFGYDDATLSPEARNALATDWQCLQKLGKPRTKVAGHTDERGTTEYNVALGERRAQAVRKYLQGLGADPKLLRATSYGKERPADAGHTEAAWAKNRRVELSPEEAK